jgi:hypothetical protein
MKEFLNFSKKTNCISLVVMMIRITGFMFIAACYCDNILEFLFFVLGYIGIDIYAYIMYKSNKNK